MPKRPTMRGMGTDAFFGERPPEATRPPETPEFVKVTFYITAEQNLALEEIRLDRLRRGQKVDKSALVREALQLLRQSPEAGPRR